MTDLTLSPNTGTPLGGQTITITGPWTDPAQGTVTIDGRTATIVSWVPGTVVVTSPARTSVNAWGNSFTVIGSASVAVVVTEANTTTHTGIYNYTSTILDQALQGVRQQIATLSVQNGDNYTIGPSQVDSVMTDQSIDTGAPLPQVVVGCIMMDVVPDQPYTFDTGTAHCFARAVLDLGVKDDWDFALRCLWRDLHHAIRTFRGTDAYGITEDAKKMMSGQILNASPGTRAAVQVEFDIEVKFRNTDMNLNV